MPGLLNTKEIGPGADQGAPQAGQDSYDMFVKNGLQLIYNKDSLPQLLSSIEGNGIPVEGLANTLIAIMSRLKDSAEKSGQTIPEDVVNEAAAELIEHIADLSSESDGHKFTKEETDAALARAAEMFTSMNQGAPAAGAGQSQPAGAPQSAGQPAAQPGGAQPAAPGGLLR